MLRRAALVLLVVCLAAPTGCGRRLFGSSRGDHAPDDMFLQFAAMQARDVIDLSEPATREGSTEAVRALARGLVTDQHAALDRITQVASRRHVTLPSQSDTRHQADLQRLAALSGDAFDREYLSLMVADREFILSTYEDRAHTARARSVRLVASDTIPVLRQDLDQVRRVADSTVAAAP